MQPPHTQEKLAVYKEYLINYLSVMSNISYWNIAVWEPFASEGVNTAGEKGSAMIAAETIKDFRVKKDKDIRLFLNELNPQKYQRLEKSMEPYSDFVGVFNMDAKDFLDEIIKFLSSSRKIHSLIFIDPYGYTQYTKENLVRLLNLSRIDYLIFMPTSHIYRFHGKEDNPARQFALDLGVKPSTLSKSASSKPNYDIFSAELLAGLKKIAESDYGYSYKLENKEASNTYHHLFFITKERRGAEQFLKAKDKLKVKLQQQLTFFDFNEIEIKKDLSDMLQKPITNTKLSDEMIKKGYLPKEINPLLKKMEKDGKLKIFLISPHSKRRKGSFYLNDKEENLNKIGICLNHEKLKD